MYFCRLSSVFPKQTATKGQEAVIFNMHQKPNHHYHHQVNLDNLKKDISRHENNLKMLKSEANQLDECILEMQVSLVKCHSSGEAENEVLHSEEETRKQVLEKEKTAAALLCQAKNHPAFRSSNVSFNKDMLGIVATLARVDGDNLSRLLSEYLGLETMLGIVCRTDAGIKSLEKYDRDGKINAFTGLHGLGSSIGRKIHGRFLVICLEDLRSYVGEFVPNDRQKKLALSKPKLSNEEMPSGFLDFAVNMVYLNDDHLSFLTADGYGLRETLFYSLLSHLQVYSTRVQMVHALPCITHGALSLDGGMIRKNGVIVLGNREDVGVKFPVILTRPDLPANHYETEDRIKMLQWERLNIDEDIRREQSLLDKTKALLTMQP